MPDFTNANDIDALLDALTPSASGFGNVEMHRTDALRYHRALTALVAERDELKDELERERMRLAACGVVAISNTRDTAKENREVSDEYKSSSFDQVCAAVDREMALRERIAELESQPPADRDLRERLVCAIWPQILHQYRASTTPFDPFNDAREDAVIEADKMIAEMRKGGGA